MHFLTPSASPGLASGMQSENAAPLESQEDVIGAWQAADFGNFQLSLEDQVAQLVDMQENRLNQRKELADKTKSLKAELSDSGSELVRLYQKSLDDVTVQAKFSASAFLTAYKILRELPDPLAALTQAEQRVKVAQTRVKYLEEREESLANALRASREKAKGIDELRAEREQYKESVQLDGAAKFETEKVAAQEKVVQAQMQFDEELAKVQSQLNLALEEIDRLRAFETESSDALTAGSARARASSEELVSARSEGYANAERIFTMRLAEAARAAEESSRQYVKQLDDLHAAVSGQIEQISELKSELSTRPERGEVDKLKAQLAIMTRLTSDNPQMEQGEEGALDGLEVWLLSTNQRLMQELSQAKDDLSKLKQEVDRERASRDESYPTAPVHEQLLTSENVSEDVKSSQTALKMQRDRLRAVLEKRDLEIERLQNQIDDRDQKNRRLEDDAEKLRQRVRFLQSYKVSDKSTLLPGAADPEAAAASLGRGVGHEFRALWESDQRPRSIQETLRASILGKRRDIRVIFFVGYLFAVHVWLLLLLAHGCGVMQ